MATNPVTKIEPQQMAAVSETAAILSVIERAAMNPDVDIDKMERLLQMQERIVARNAKSAYSAALSEMQPKLPAIAQNGKGHGSIKYAKWEDIQTEITPHLAAHGFALSFRVAAGERVTVTAVLSHREGHSEDTSLPLPTDTTGSKNAVQAVGSSISYGKRYTACALLNLNIGGEDDNGRAAGDDCITEDQELEIKALITQSGADVVRFLKYLGAETVETIPANKYNRAIGALKAKRETAQ